MTNVRPRGYGWSVYPNETGFDVFDHWTKTVVTSTETRGEAWVTVATLSRASVAARDAMAVAA